MLLKTAYRGMKFIPCGGKISTKHNQILKFHNRLLFNYLGMTLHTPAFSEQALTVFVQLYHRIIQRQLLHNFIFSSFLYPNSSLFIVRAISLMSLLNVSLSPINSETLGAFLIWACDVGCSLSVLFFKYSQVLNILSNLAD